MVGVSPCYRDFHSHLVPGVDDGSPTLADALHSVGRMTAAGVKGIVTTPHFRASWTQGGAHGSATLEFMDRRWKKLRDAARVQYPELDLRRGLEVKLDVPDPDLSDPRTRLGGTAFALVEWPMFRVPPTGTPQALGRLRDAGWIPVVAHPERYAGIESGLSVVRAWKEAGAYLQCNYGSLAGQYGTEPREMAFRLLAAGLVDYLSSDFHGHRHYMLRLEPAAEALRALGGAEQLRLLASANPARLFEGRLPLPVPALPEAKSLRKRVRAWIDG